MNSLKKQNDTLNAFKGIACVLVVFIHVPFPGIFGEIVVSLSRSAVALFFVISGYYLLNEDREMVESRLPSKIKNIAQLTLSAFLIYFIWESFVRFIGSGIDSVIYWYTEKLFTVENFLKVILISYDPVVGHLWFLMALLGSYILFLFINKFKIEKYACWIALPMLETHIIVMSLSGLFGWNMNLSVFRNVWFYGLPFVLLGYSLRQNEFIIKKNRSEKILALISIGAIALTLVERVFLGRLQIYNGTILFTLSIFLIAVYKPEFKGPKSLVNLGKRYSNEIYIFHWMVMEIDDKFKSILHINSLFYDWVEPIIIFFVTLIAAWVIVNIKEKVKKVKEDIK